MDLLTFVLFLAGIVLLIVGAEALVRGAATLAVSAGISPLVVGLTVVALATSSPELAVSLSSVLGDDGDIAVGNIVGSNILNVLLILGLAAVVAPLVVSDQLVRLDVPLMIGASALVFLFAIGGTVNRLEGIVLVAGVVSYSAWVITKSRRETSAARQAAPPEIRVGGQGFGWATLNVFFVVVGLGLLVLGSDWFVDGAVEFAETLGVSRLVIGLTIVSVGTSMPELATSIMASVRGQRDIAVGNVVGSNLFNLLAVLGITAVVADGGVAVASAALRFDIPVMLAVAVACLPIFFTGFSVARWEGLLFLGYYAAYTGYLLLDASGHDAVGPYSAVMLGFVAPLTMVTLAVLGLRALRDHRRAGGRAREE